MREASMRAVVVIALAATGGLAGAVPDSAHAKVTKREFCAVMQYCRIPARYRNGPFLAKPVIREVSLVEVKRGCSAGGDVASKGILSEYILGCARIVGANCVIYVPKEVRTISSEIFDMVLEHELAHCRGWVHGN
jgi:hypothetical protein